MAEIFVSKLKDLNKPPFVWDANEQAIKCNEHYFVLKEVDPDYDATFIYTNKEDIHLLLLLFQNGFLALSSLPSAYLYPCGAYSDLTANGSVVDFLTFSNPPRGTEIIAHPLFVPFTSIFDDILLAFSKVISHNEEIEVVNPTNACNTQKYTALRLTDYIFLLVR